MDYGRLETLAFSAAPCYHPLMDEEAELIPSPSNELIFDDQLWTPPKRLNRRDKPQRVDANAATDEAFELIGGVPRLAHWANENPEIFYTKIWNKRLITESKNEVNGSFTIVSAIPPSSLDEAPEEFIDAEIIQRVRIADSIPDARALPSLPREDQALRVHGSPQTGGEDSSVRERASGPSSVQPKEEIPVRVLRPTAETGEEDIVGVPEGIHEKSFGQSKRKRTNRKTKT